MTIDIEKIKAAALDSVEDWYSFTKLATPSIILELITRLEAAESELNVCCIEYGDVRDSYLHYKEKCEAAEKDAAQYLHTIKHIKHSMTQASILGNDKTREIALSLAMCNAVMKESEK